MRSGCTSDRATPRTPTRSRSWKPGSARMGRCRRTPEPRGTPRGVCSRNPGTTSSTISDGERREGDARGPDHEIQREGRHRSGPARGDRGPDEDGPDRIEGRDEVSFRVEGPARGRTPRRRRGPCGHHDLDGRRHPRSPDSTRGRTVQGVCDRKAPTQRKSGGSGALSEVLLTPRAIGLSCTVQCGRTTAVAGPARCGHVAGWGSQDISSGSGFWFRRMRTCYPYARVTKIRLAIPDWMDSDSQVVTFIVDGPGGPTLGRLSMDRVKTGIVGLDTMLNGGFLPARPYVVSGP